MYKLTVITPERVVFDEQVYTLVAYGGEGYLQILTNHCSILSTLQSGKLSITKENREKLVYAVSGGFLEFSKNVATILADTMEAPNEIDLARAEAAARRAEERLNAPEGEVDVFRAKMALRRARNRIHIYNEICLSRPVKIQI